jgi:hypothetical protein
VGNRGAASFRRSSDWPAPSSLPTAKNAEEFFLGDCSRKVAENVYDGEPAQNVRTGIVSTIQIPRFPLSPIG